MSTSSVLKRVALFLVVASVLFFTSLPAEAQEEVTIGFTYPATGQYAAEGLDELQGAQLAEEEINNGGGILGKKIKLIIRDSRSDRATGRKNAIDFARDGVKMIFGEISSDVTVAVSEVAYNENIIFFAAMGASMDITGKNGYITTFRQCSDAWMAAGILGTYLIDKHHSEKYFYVLADYNWGWTTEAAIRFISDTIDVDVHKRAKIGLEPEDDGLEIRNALEAARQANPKVLVLILFGKQFVTAIQIAHELGLNKDIQIVVPSLTTTMAENAGPSLMEGVIGATFWDWKVPTLPYVNSAKGDEFVRKFKDKYNRLPSAPAASAYTVLHQYKDAVEKAQDFQTNKVISALEGSEYELLKGKQQWRKFDHQSIQRVFLVQGRPRNKVLVDNDYFDIKFSMDGHEVAIQKLEWTWDRLVSGKSPELER